MSAEARFNAEEADLFEKKGWLNYAKRLISWRWSAEDHAFPARQAEREAMSATLGVDVAKHPITGCANPDCFIDFTGKKSPEPKPASRFKAEVVSTPATPVEPPLRLSEAGHVPLQTMLGKGLAVVGGAVAVGAIVQGGITATHGALGYRDKSTNEEKKPDAMRLVIGLAELSAGAAGLLLAVMGRIKFWGPVQIGGR